MPSANIPWRFALAKGNRDWARCYDQTVTNYVLHKGFTFDTESLRGMVGYVSGIYDDDMAEGNSILRSRNVSIWASFNFGCGLGAVRDIRPSGPISL